MATVFVTGANGFIGSHLVDHLLRQGHRVIAMVRQGSNTEHLRGSAAEIRRASVGDPAAMATAMDGVDLVYHVAGMTAGRSPADYDRVNGQGTAHVFQAARKAKPGPGRIVLVSSLAAAGPSHPEVARKEHHDPRPVSTYGRSKAKGEQEAWKAALEGAEVVIVRPPAVYGPRDEDFLQVIELARRGLVLRLGFARSWFSIVHSADLVRGIVLAGERGRALPRGGPHALGGQGTAPDDPSGPDHPHGQGIYHFADGGRYTWAELGQHAAQAHGRSAVTVTVPVPIAWVLAVASEWLGQLRGQVPIFNRDKVREGSASGWWADHGKAASELGWAPELPYPRGIEETVRGIREAQTAR